MTMKTTSEYAAFEKLWQSANAQQEELQVAQIDEPDTGFTPVPMLQFLSDLTDALAAADTIDGDQSNQMHAAISTLEEVIQAIDPDALATALKTVNAQPLPAQ